VGRVDFPLGGGKGRCTTGRGCPRTFRNEPFQRGAKALRKNFRKETCMAINPPKEIMTSSKWRTKLPIHSGQAPRPNEKKEKTEITTHKRDISSQKKGSNGGGRGRKKSIARTKTPSHSSPIRRSTNTALRG